MSLVDRRVIIIGAGVVGAAAANALVRAGAAVTVLDRGSSAGGTSGAGEGNLLVSDKGPGPELDMARRSLQLWRGQAAELVETAPRGAPALEFEVKGGLVVATTEAGATALSAFAATQATTGVTVDALSAAEALEREPALTPRITAAYHYPQDAQVQPVAATELLLADGCRRGVHLRQGVTVTGALIEGQRVVGVSTSDGDVRGDDVVVAAGPWSGELAARLDTDLPVRPRRGTVLVTTRMPPCIRHKVYDADYVGAVGSDAAHLQTSSVVEATAAGTVLIGSSRERRGFDERIEADVVAALAAKAIALFPFLATATLLRAYGGFRPYVPDHLPVVGPDPRRLGLWFATGHEGAGIGLAPATAELLVDLMSGRPGVLDPAAFALDRPTLAPHLTAVAR